MKLFYIIFFPMISMAGVMNGGGGKSIVCRNSHGKIIKSELLDLYEGRVQYQLKYQETAESWEEQGLSILARAGLKSGGDYPNPNPNMARPIVDLYLNVVRKLVFIPEGTELESTEDSFEVVSPKDCKIEQAAIYQNDQRILVSQEIWNSFSQTQRAALIIHESVYRYLRYFDETNSIRARHFTSHIISGGVIKDDIVYTIGSCFQSNNLGTKVFIEPVFKNAQGEEIIRLVFTRLGNRQLMSYTFVDLHNSVHLGLSQYTILELLKRPLDSTSFNYELKTTSLFEGNDEIRLSIGAGKVQLRGISSLDSSYFESTLTCN